MRNRHVLSLKDVAVVLVCVVLLSLTLGGMDRGGRRHAKRIVCQANLAILGKGQLVYANDYEGMFTVQGGDGMAMWSDMTPGFANPSQDWSVSTEITVGASLYLLVREADMDVKYFVCSTSGQIVYEGQNPIGLDVTELWDFGLFRESATMVPDIGIGNSHGPKSHVSYGYHMPYGETGGQGRYAAHTGRSSSFALMADKSPWYDPKLLEPLEIEADWEEYVGFMGNYYSDPGVEPWQVQIANAYAHQRVGQNVLFVDGSCSFERTTDVGVGHDSIYTIRGEGGTEDDIRLGDTSVTNYTIDSSRFQPRSSEDSFLVNDDSRGYPYN